MRTTEDLIALINAQHKTTVAHHQANEQALASLSGRMLGVEQRIAAGDGHSFSPSPRSWGAQITASDQFKQFSGAMAKQGSVRIPIKAGITIATGSGDTLAAPDQQPAIVSLPQQRLTVRQLLAPGQTGSDLVRYVRMVSRDNNAAPVAPGNLKPESGLTFELAEAPVRTIAHWIPVHRQMMDDAAGLQSLIDSEMRYGVDIAEEDQLLFGDGVGENILGLVPQATTYTPPFEVESKNMLDELLLAIAQAEQSLVPATGIIVNDLDWRRMQALKDGTGRYLGVGPFGPAINLAWQVPVVHTPTMQAGEFLVGGFSLAAQILDRMEMEVLISSEDRDNFVKNMLTVRAEKRLALAVKRPSAIIYGEFETPSG